MSRVWAIGDIHGANKALQQCLERAGVNKEEDTVIQLGDVADGWSEVYEAVETLLSIKNLIAIRGNHDEWFLDFLVHGEHGAKWLQGGIGTLKSYCNNTDSLWEHTQFGYRTSLNNLVIPISHIEFFKNQLHYYIDSDHNCFVHGGFNRHHTMEVNNEQEPWQFWWDRDLWYSALSHHQVDTKFKIKDDFKEVFIGHTTTQTWDKTCKPMKAANIWNLDQGAGWSGKLTIMDVNTKEYFQSDLVRDLYPDEKGRN